MIKKISSILLILVLASCANIIDKMPKRKASAGGSDTLADVFCKNE